jgi:hypothetical protein
VSDETEDRDGTGEEVTEQAGEQQVGAWSEPAAAPRWSEIASEAEGAAASGAAASEPAAESQPATEAARARRPSSLRSDPAASSDVPRRRLVPPSFARASSKSETPAAPPPDSQSNSPVSDVSGPGSSGQMSNAGGSLLDKLPAKKLQKFVKERPEAGLGLAFIGGLLIATILRRLAR